jgi:threonine/homoserine/homoserine lactone efflux protein
MYDTFGMFFLALALGLTGALAPGPTLVATINASFTGGWTTGPKVTLGHMVVESVIFILIVMGLAAVALPYSHVIAGIGGIALVAFGVLTITGSRQVSLEETSSGTHVTNPYFSGAITSAANPFFWIWWLSVGSAMVIAGLQGGIVLAGVFMAGHWCADLGWYTVVSTGIAQGRAVLSDQRYRWIMGICGLFLIAFGIYYLYGVFVTR